MKVGISVKKPDETTFTNERFGRALHFAIYDTDEQSLTFFDNSSSVSSEHGAGVSTSQNLINQGVDAVISGNFGENAAKVLRAAGVKMYVTESRPLMEVIEDFLQGKLKEF